MSDEQTQRALAVPRDVRAVTASDCAVLLEVERATAHDALDAVHALFFAFTQAAPAWVTDLHPAYGSLLVEVDARSASADDVLRFVHALPTVVERAHAPRTHVLPVRYGAGDPCDLDAVAAELALDRDDVIARHTASALTVAFLGFLPGFAYLAGLDARLRVPRLAAPRARVPTGAVAIAAGQAAVYPTDGPGGWRVLGVTDVDVHALAFELGDRVRFEAIA